MSDCIIIDFTLYRLEKLLEKESNWQRAEILEALIDAYSEGLVSVDWDDGEPLFIATDEQIDEMHAILSGSVIEE